MSTNYDQVPLKEKEAKTPEPTTSPVDDKVGKVEEHVAKEPVVSSAAVQHKPTFFEREQARVKANFKQTMRTTVFPGLRGMAYTVVDAMIRTILLGDSAAPVSSTVKSSGGTIVQAAASRFAYDSINKKSNIVPINTTQKQSYNDIALQFQDKEEAYKVVAAMGACIEQFGFVSVRDLYEYADCTNLITPQDENYGWKTTGGFRVSKGEDGTWLLKMPGRVYNG